MIIDTDHYLSIKEFADKIGKKPQFLRHHITTGTLKAQQIWGFWVIHVDSLKQWSASKGKFEKPIKHNLEGTEP